jgi:hypothetical protein
MPRGLEIPIAITGIDKAVDAIRKAGAETDKSGKAMERALDQAARAGVRAFRQQQSARTAAEREWAGFTRSVQSQFSRGVAQETIAGQGPPPSRAAAGGFFSTGYGALTTVTGALLGFAAAVRSATEALANLGAARLLTGGTAGDVAGLGRFGLVGPEAASAAASFRGRISSDPMAMMYAARLGVRELPRPFGSANEAEPLGRALEQIKALKTQEDRLTYARALGQEQVVKYLEASPAVQAAVERQSQLEEKMIGSSQAAADLAVQTELLGRAWTTFTGALAGSLARGGVIDDLQTLSDILQGRETWEHALYGSQRDAVQENTDAVKQNTDAVKGAFLGPGQYGGGQYTNAAMPGGWSGDFLARQMETGALSKGLPGV